MSICGTFSMSGIPDGRQDQVIDGYRNNIPPPDRVTSARQPDGRWTVTAQWSPCPPGTTMVHTSDSNQTTWQGEEP